MSRSVEVVFQGRQTGKTQFIVEDAYRSVRAGLTVAIFAPSIQQVRDITIRWSRMYPSQPVPYSRNLLAINGRGRIFDRIYIDNIDHVTEGLHDDHVQNLMLSVSQNGGVMIVTCSPTPYSFISHRPKPPTLLERFKRHQAGKQELQDTYWMALTLANETGVSLKTAMAAIRRSRSSDPEATSE